MLSRRKRVLIGIGLVVLGPAALAAYSDWGAIAEALGKLHWAGFLAICALQVGSIALCGAAWWALTERAGFFACTAARWIREGGSSILALLPGIGELGGARALKLFGAKSSDAAASTVVDIVTESLSQLVFTLFGIVPLLGAAGGSETVQALGAVLAAVPPALAILFVSRSKRALALLERVVVRIGQALGLATAHLDLASNVRSLYGHRRRVVVAVVLHFVAWTLGAAQVWVAAQALGHPLPPASAWALVSLGYAARGAFFMVPMGAGVQELSFVLVGSLLGVAEANAIALSLVLRARDIALGLPAVLAWFAAEARERSVNARRSREVSV
jgi:putative membrane protein